MAELGRVNLLRVLREAGPGMYVDGEEYGEILLPWKFVPPGTQLDDKVAVFVHHDSEDRLIATTETPKAMVGDIAVLTVSNVAPGLGAFLDWGLRKDLLLPFREMDVRVHEGERVVAYVYIDDQTQRILATTRLREHLQPPPANYEIGQPAALLIVRQTPLGFMALIERQHFGLLYHSDATLDLYPGDAVQGYIAAMRPDGKIDLTLESSGGHRVFTLTEQILEALTTSGGKLDVDDDSSPEVIRARFGASKKAFKQAVGALYKQRLIRLTKPGIALAK